MPLATHLHPNLQVGAGVSPGAPSRTRSFMLSALLAPCLRACLPPPCPPALLTVHWCNLACCCFADTDDAALNAEIDRHLSSAFLQPCQLLLCAVCCVLCP